MKPAYKVVIIESERGWGQRIDEVKLFRGEDAKKDADEFVKNYNADNNLPYVPDWYMYAQKPILIDEDEIK